MIIIDRKSDIVCIIVIIMLNNPNSNDFNVL